MLKRDDDLIKKFCKKIFILLCLFFVLLNGCNKASDTVTTAVNVEKQNDFENKQDIIVFVTYSGEKYHKENCRYLKYSKIPVDLDTARKTYDPCSICKPPK